MTNLNLIKTALLGLSDAVYHYHAPPNCPVPYLVWAEDGANDFVADDKHLEMVYQGTIDLYTKNEDDPLMQSVPAALNGIPAAWYLNSVQFEDDTGLIHYEWVFEV